MNFFDLNEHGLALLQLQEFEKAANAFRAGLTSLRKRIEAADEGDQEPSDSVDCGLIAASLQVLKQYDCPKLHESANNRFQIFGKGFSFEMDERFAQTKDQRNQQAFWSACLLYNYALTLHAAAFSSKGTINRVLLLKKASKSYKATLTIANSQLPRSCTCLLLSATYNNMAHVQSYFTDDKGAARFATALRYTVSTGIAHKILSEEDSAFFRSNTLFVNFRKDVATAAAA